MRTLQISLLAFLTLTITGCESGSISKDDYAPTLTTKLDTISYLYGYVQGKNMNQQGLEEFDYSIFFGAMNEAMAGEETKVDMIEGGKIVRAYINERREQMGEENLAKAEDFLAKNKEKEGIVTTETGLQYEVIEEGEGESPALTDRVKVHYHGTLLNGEVFDSSIDKGVPATFNVNGVVKGWTEVLQIMKPGAKYKLYVPPSLGYGPRGSRSIGPNELLTFDIELLEIVQAPPPPPPAPTR